MQRVFVVELDPMLLCPLDTTFLMEAFQKFVKVFCFAF